MCCDCREKNLDKTIMTEDNCKNISAFGKEIQTIFEMRYFSGKN